MKIQRLLLVGLLLTATPLTSTPPPDTTAHEMIDRTPEDDIEEQDELIDRSEPISNDERN